MRRWRWLGLLLTLAACSHTTSREYAVDTCRRAGYLGAVEDAGSWYCFKDRLGAPPVVVPAKP
jgi:hypothetical protein